MAKIDIPSGARVILRQLRKAGYDAYIVGGCVRDSLIGKQPNDWDICTSATPREMMQVLSEHRTIATGLHHGTITVVVNEQPYEVTTFRVDGAYSDSRHPDSVRFVRDINEDLARRDFTINAMAYNETAGLIDPFHGAKDLKKGVIACVGNPDARFEEDALRVLRALRFASTYGFQIAPETSKALRRYKNNLNQIAKERIQTELSKLLMGSDPLTVLTKYRDVLGTIIPEFSPCMDFCQNNQYHKFNVYDHIIHSVAYDNTRDMIIRLALFFHDIGKPYCCTDSETGRRFYGHALISSEITDAVMKRLRFDNKTKDAVRDLVFHHDAIITNSPKTIKRWLNKIGYEQFCRLMYVKKADILAQRENIADPRLMECDEILKTAKTILDAQECFQLSDLAVDGQDIMRLTGARQGKSIGEWLRKILNAVMAGEVENTKEAIEIFVKERTLNE